MATPFSLRQHIWLSKLRRQPYFHDIVRRLAEGRTTRSVAQWLVTIRPTGELAHLSFETWLSYIRALSPHVRRYVRESPKPKYSKARVKEVVEKVNRETATLDVLPPEDSGYDQPLYKATRKVLKDIDSETLLKCAAQVQMTRVAALIKMEEGGRILKGGNDIVLGLAHIAAEIRKFEVNERILTGKGLGVEQNFVSANPSPVFEAFNKLNEVDRNLVREATQNVITMIRKEANAKYGI